MLTRQDVPTLDRTRFASPTRLAARRIRPRRRPRWQAAVVHANGNGVRSRADRGGPRAILARKIAVRLVSLPSWELFDAQPREYRDAVLPPSVGARLAVEAGVPLGWHCYVGDRGDVLGVERFGASAPSSIMLREYGFTATTCTRALAILR